ncbi:MAG: hypothetical protein ACPG5B_15880 [Chitinophagales bacterium]
MKKIVLLIILFQCLVCGSILAQNLEKEDVIYLKNGGVIRGTIIEYVADGAIKIEVVGQNILVFETDEVEKMQKEAVLTYRKKKRGVYFSESRYANHSSFGILFSQNDGVSSSIETVNSYRIKPYLSLGAGVGLMWMNTWRLGWARAMPIFVDVRGDVLPKARTTPFYYTQIGYGIDTAGELNDERKGGVYFALGTGIKIRTRSKMAFTFGIGYMHQHQEIRETDWWNDGQIIERSINYRRIAFRTGFAF